MQRPTASGAVSAAAPAGRAGGEDRGLVDRAQAGDAGAFETLVRRYQGWVFTLALRMVGDRAEAEDLAQEIFLKAYRGLKRFKGASRFSTWLYSITSHHCLNHLEARRRQPHRHGRGGERPDAGGDDPPAPVDRLADDAPRADALLEREERARIVQAELAQLAEDHRIILVLREVQGLSYEEIAQVLGVELGTVRSRLHRARMEMKARLAPYL
ncbi:MAG: sigma-70 family RNA polymerase sigma factor [candidate division NC10 bacterium]|nr:sigma-70 family RNA polymerase sigma factor [candidate division NC10 bacterium]